MSGFAIRSPYFIVVVCLVIAAVGVTSLAAVPPGLTWALILYLTQTSMNVMSLTGLMILIVEYTRRLREDGMLLPMMRKLGAGSKSYTPLWRAVPGGMSVSLMMTVIMVPAAYYVAYRKADTAQPEGVF